MICGPPDFCGKALAEAFAFNRNLAAQEILLDGGFAVRQAGFKFGNYVRCAFAGIGVFA